MVTEMVLYTLGIYFISKCLVVLIFKKPIMKGAAKLLRKKKSINKFILLEILLGIVLLGLGYLISRV